YAARRAGLHLDRDFQTEYDTSARRLAVLEEFASTLRCTVPQARALSSRIQLHQFVSGERLQRQGEPPAGVHIIVDGRSTMFVSTPDGALLEVTDLVRGHIVGLTSLT